jgi:serine/threonine-protein kinase
LIASRLASGSFGQIYRAHDPQLNRPVALKLLRRDITLFRPVDRLLAEARTLAQVRHSNVVTVHGADVRDGRAGLWMELVDGQTLEAWLGLHGQMGAGEAASIGVDLCRALAAVHREGLVHGDVKAQNVMREKGGRIVLMDFGAGRAQGAGAVGVAGTPMYLAPEVLAGAPPTPTSDLYSLGILLFHLLTNRFPYSASDIDTLRAAHAEGERTWLRDLRPDLPHGLVQTIERVIDPDPARRFASAGAMERALHLDIEPVVARALDNRSVPGPATWLRPGFAIAAVAFLATVVALVVWSRTSSNRGTVLSGIRTIGVLPMSDSTSSGIPAEVAAGLGEEVTSALGQIHALTVKPGSSLGPIEGKTDKQIARLLDVDALLKTSVTSSGGINGQPPRLKVRARLLAAGTQAIVWDQVFERRRGDSSALANDIATAITRAVTGVLTPAESARLTSVRQTNPAAEDAYLAGRAYIEGYGGRSADAALKAFQRALQLDPSHAAAHAGAARAYITVGENGLMSYTEACVAALAEVQQSLDHDPDLADAHALLGYIRFAYQWDWPGSEREFQRSLDLNPNSLFALAYYARFFAAQGRFDDALSHAERATRLDPQSGSAAREYALFLYYKGDLAAAEQALREPAAMENNQPAVPLVRGRLAEARGDFEGALADTRQALRLTSGATPVRVQEARLQALAGHKDDARANLALLQREADARKIRLNDRDVAYIELALGNRARAIQFFDKAVNARDPSVVWLGVDPRVDDLRGDARFREMLKTIGLPMRLGEAR